VAPVAAGGGGEVDCAGSVYLISSIRNIRAEQKIDLKKKIAPELLCRDQSVRELVARNRDTILRLGSLSDLQVVSGKLGVGGAIRSTPRFDVRVPYLYVVDVEGEKARLKKELEGLQRAISSKESQLGNETFRSRAPEKIIRGLEETLATQRIELKKLVDRLGQL
jgi:valyl-tRNA synthetase